VSAMPKIAEKTPTARSEVSVWLAPADHAQPELPYVFSYRPALMFECLVEFRDIRAEVIHAKDAFYTAWLPEGTEEMVIDWSLPALPRIDAERFETEPRPSIRPHPERLRVGKRLTDEAQTDLIDYLVRRETLRVFYNPSFKRYSKLGEDEHEFIHRVTDEAVTQLQPQLKELANRLKLQAEQLLEHPLPDNRDDDGELTSIRRRMIAAIQNRMDAIIMGNPEALTKPLLDIREKLDVPDQIRELKEELDRIERDVLKDLNALLAEYRSRAYECQQYDIRLQPTDIRVVRRALLWVPV
jgi:hypothetical protein